MLTAIEQRVRDLLNQGWGPVRIARHLHVGTHTIFEVIHDIERKLEAS